MPTTSYLKLSFSLEAQAVEAVEHCLSQCGALSISLLDAGDQPILEPAVAQTPLWNKIHLAALFEPSISKTQVVDALHLLLGPEALSDAQWDSVKDEAWELKWLDYFEPLSFGKRLWIGSAHHSPPSDSEALIYFEPGLAFGTGTHPSTYLCLEALSQQDLQGRSLLDYGCGSGILSIAAAKLGATPVMAVDNDPQALTATRANALANQVQVSTFLPSELPSQDFDIIVANILANPLIALAPHLESLLKPEGQLILAGLLKSQASAVKAAYPHILWQETVHKEEWICLQGIVWDHIM